MSTETEKVLLSYCMKCKEKHNVINAEIIDILGKKRLKGNCEHCQSKVSTFLKGPEKTPEQLKEIEERKKRRQIELKDEKKRKREEDKEKKKKKKKKAEEEADDSEDEKPKKKSKTKPKPKPKAKPKPKKKAVEPEPESDPEPEPVSDEETDTDEEEIDRLLKSNPVEVIVKQRKPIQKLK